MEGGLAGFARLRVNMSCLKVPGCWSSTTKKDAGCADADAGSGVLYFGNHCSRLRCGYLRRLHNWYGDWLSIRYGEYVFSSCGGMCCFWNLKCGDLLTHSDLSLAFFSLVLYFTQKLHCLIPEVKKVSIFKEFNLGVEIIAERLSFTWSGVLTCTEKS